MSVGNANGGVAEDTKIGIIVGSTRPGRRSGVVAAWAKGVSVGREGVAFDVVDIADAALPMLDEPTPAAMGGYTHVHTQRWAEVVSRYDGFIFVVPEYNHSFPGALKNAVDFLYAEWQNKAAGLLTYGITGGVRAGEQLRLVLAEVSVACVRTHVALSLQRDFAVDETDALNPGVEPTRVLNRMLDELILWTRAMKAVREQKEDL